MKTEKPLFHIGGCKGMDINIFYEDIYYEPGWRKGMDVLKLNNSVLEQVKELLKDKKINWNTIVFGRQIYGWTGCYDVHVWENDPPVSDLSIIKELFPDEKYGTKVFTVKK